MITTFTPLSNQTQNSKSLISRLLVVGLVSALLILIPQTSSSASLVSKFQAQSPVSVYIPASQPVPAQGSTVTLSFDRADFTGTNADQDYAQAIAMATTATVRYVVADLGYRDYPNVGTIANDGDLGYLVLLDFGSGVQFSYAYVGYIEFATAATSIDATGTSGLYHYVSGGVDYLWAPSTLDTSNITGVVDAWSFQSLTAITATASHTLDCLEVQGIGAQNACAALSNKAGTSMTIASAPNSDVAPDRFYGLAGLSSTIVGGLVQTSIVSLPAQVPIVAESNTPKYSGPELDAVNPNRSILAGQEFTASGKKLDIVTSASIGGQSIKFTYSETDGLTFETPSDLKPGTYDLELQSAYGKLTHLNAITIKAPVTLTSFSLRGSGSKIDAALASELTNISSMFGSNYKKITCVVNVSDPEVAAALAAHVCKYMKAGDLRSATVAAKAKSTFKGDGFWVRVYLAG